ncbi:hypothetical protein [Streptomyces sp. bgisy034]|uniref:hypothetical protein n=1 Tax=Streptomyces sp. bgisy034 TaxID=3413774 RepID=UPI003EBE303A
MNDHTQPPNTSARRGAPAQTREERARTHIKAAAGTIKAQCPEQLAQPAGLFMSGMLTGLAASVEILDGGTAEGALENVNTRLAAAVGEAYLAGTLPARPAVAETDRQPTREEEVRGVQAWMAMDLHQALGLAVDEQATHQGHGSWADWWADLCGSVRQRTYAQQAHTRALIEGPSADHAELIDLATRKMIEEGAAPEGTEVSALEALGYHATGLSYALERVESERDGAYRERAHLVALLAAMTDGSVIAPAPDVDEPGWQIVYLFIRGGQASWHISPRDGALFEDIEHVAADDPRAQWDGHTTEEKYGRIRRLTAQLARRCGPACSEGHTYTGRCEGARSGAPCAQHPNAPVIGGVCGGCTQHPSDMTKGE